MSAGDISHCFVQFCSCCHQEKLQKQSESHSQGQSNVSSSDISSKAKNKTLVLTQVQL